MKWAQRAEAVRKAPTTDELFQIERIGCGAAVWVAGAATIGELLDRNSVGARVRLADPVSVGMPITVTFTDYRHVDHMMGFVAKCIPERESGPYVIGIEVDQFMRQRRS